MDPSINRTFLTFSAFFFAAAAVAGADNWPGWRGPNGDGKSAEKNLPTTWSDTKNVKWKIDLPEKGHSAPVVWGNRIFLAQPLDAAGNKRALWCLDRADGKHHWEQAVPYNDKEPKHSTGTYCAATPVTDGERVIVNFGSAGLYCYDFAGNANTYVFDASPQFAEPTRNSLGKEEQTRSTMAFSDGEIFIRTFRHLWCISEKK